MFSTVLSTPIDDGGQYQIKYRIVSEWQTSRLIVTYLLYITTDCTKYDIIKSIQHSVVGSHFGRKKSSPRNQNNFNGTVDFLLRAVQKNVSALRGSTLAFFRPMGSTITWFHSMGSTLIWIYPITIENYLFCNTYTSIILVCPPTLSISCIARVLLTVLFYQFLASLSVYMSQPPHRLKMLEGGST